MTQFTPQSAAGRRRGGRARVAFIAGVAGCSLVALAALAVIALSGALPAGIALTLALLPIPALLSGVLWLDRLEPEPPGMLVLIFLCGAAAAALIGLAGTLASTGLITTPALRHDGFAAASTGAVIGVALLEETLKGAALAGLLLRRPEEIDGIHDGVVYGSMVGLGFALIENLYYYSQATHYGFGGVAATFVLRGVVSPVCQALFSSLVGAGVVLAARFGLRRGFWAVGGGWLAAVVLHAFWNEALGAGVARLALTYAFFAVVVAVLMIAVVADRRRIIGLIVRYLPQHEADRIATDLDIAMLSSLADRRLARQWARLHGGLAALRAMVEYQLDATELGLLHRRSDRGLVDGDSFAVQRDGLVSDMRSAAGVVRSRAHISARPPWAPHGPSFLRPSAPPQPAEPAQRPPTETGPARPDA